jgi:Kef-type K+ transport system membrane component KefB
MSFGTLTLIGLCGLCGPLLSMTARGVVPVVVGEIAAGVIIGRTGLRAIDTGNVTLVFLSNIGFAMLMLSVGMNVPLREPRLRTVLGQGALAAAVVGFLAVGAGLLVGLIGGAGHPAVFAVLVASGSAAVVLPVIQDRKLKGPAVLTVIAQVTVADIAATLAVPFVLLPARAGRVAAGTALICCCLLAIFVVGRVARRAPAAHALRREGKHRRWAIDLRLALIVLFFLAWIAQRTGASLLIAGFGAGLMVAALGGPKRLSTEVLGVGGGFFVPLFFVVLGARIDLRGLVKQPSLIALALALAAATAVVHLLAARLTRQRRAAGLLASAQLGVPSAIVALGLSEKVINSAQGAAILLAALLSLGVCAAGAALMAERSTPPATASAAPGPPSRSAPARPR